MRLQDLEGLLEAARLGSISKASEVLHISHTALSKKIRSLETYYGVKLLQRASTGVIPTVAGKHVIERVSVLLTHFYSIHDELREYREPSVFAIGTLPSLAASFLPDRVLAMKKDGLDIQIHVRQTSEDLWGELEAGLLDGILAESISGSSAPYIRVLFKEPLLAVVHKKHPFSMRASIDQHELAEEPLLLHPPACGIRKWVENTLKRSGKTPIIVCEVGFGGFIAGMVAAGAGITVLPESTAFKLGEPSLVSVPFNEADASRTIVFAASNKNTGGRMWKYIQVI